MFHVPEQARIVEGPMASTSAQGNNGAFRIAHNGVNFFVIASDGLGWEHVSISPASQQRCPTWDEMAFFKDAFWGPEDTVLQFHPPKSEYVNIHRFCLHLWRESGKNAETPPKLLTGV